MEISGLLYSQIGYDLGDPMRALIRSTLGDYVQKGSTFQVLDINTSDTVCSGEIKYWGEAWKSHWWEADYSGINKAGEYILQIKFAGQVIMASEPFKVGQNLLWNETIKAVAIEQMEERAKRTRNGNGWKDCGSAWREVNSHATMVIGLCDLLEKGHEWLQREEIDRLVPQIKRGCDYIAICQDKAERLGYPKGAIIHEVPGFIHIVPGDIAQSTVAFAKTSRLLVDIDPDKSDEYLQRAANAFGYLMNEASPADPEGFSHSNHGAPQDFNVPREWMTRDLMMMVWGAVELWFAGRHEYKEEAVKLVRQVMKRQVPEDKAEEGLYGHFYTFDSCSFTEKANTHHHFGYDTGSTFPHYIIPMMEMCGFWYNHPDAHLWREAIKKFAYGYFMPACRKNPFYLIPEGYFTNEGLLIFCGPWHGINTTIGFASTLASRLEGFTRDGEFRKIAVGNIQWIAGLNSGITNDCFKGCWVWREDVPEGAAVPYSQICGIGRKSVGCWTDIKGTIPNGFNVNPQFSLEVPPTMENDGPWLYTDEDWIPHAAGWVSALTELRERRRFSITT